MTPESSNRYVRWTPIWPIGVLLFSICFRLLSAEYRVSSAAEINASAEKLMPGDILVMANGDWTNQTIMFRAQGTTDRPIMLRAETPGKAILAGASSVTVEGEHLVVSGLCIRNGKELTNGVLLAGLHCRLTD